MSLLSYSKWIVRWERGLAGSFRSAARYSPRPSGEGEEDEASAPSPPTVEPVGACRSIGWVGQPLNARTADSTISVVPGILCKRFSIRMSGFGKHESRMLFGAAPLFPNRRAGLTQQGRPGRFPHVVQSLRQPLTDGPIHRDCGQNTPATMVRRVNYHGAVGRETRGLVQLAAAQ